jgi:hypothetical protein
MGLLSCPFVNFRLCRFPKRTPSNMNAVHNFMHTACNARGFVFNDNFAVSFSVNKTFEIQFKFMLGGFFARSPETGRE